MKDCLTTISCKQKLIAQYVLKKFLKIYRKNEKLDFLLAKNQDIYGL